MKKTLLVILILISSISSESQVHVNSVWTEQYESKVFQDIDNAVRRRMPDKEKRSLMVSYVVKRLKAELPNGIESIATDSLKRLSVQIGTEYAFLHGDGNGGGITPKYTAWTPELEKSFKLAIMKGVQKEDLEMWNNICNCFIIKLRTIYPDSVLLPFPREIEEKIARECQGELFGHIKN